jgi:hypothetical protein
MRAKTLKQLEQTAPFKLNLDLDRLPQQHAFIFDWQYRFRAYGGGLGNGKTSAGCALAWLLSVSFPGNRGLICRWDGKELRQTTMSELRGLIPSTLIEKQNDQMGYLKFKPQYGGSEIIYSDLKELRAIKNLNLGWFWIDQAEEVTDEHWTLLVSRLRKQTPLMDRAGTLLGHAKTYGFATFNPEGTNSYLWKLFHPESPDRQADYQLYMASTYDGLAAGFTSPEYVNGMLAVFPESARKRYLDGAWDVFEGRIYPECDVTHRLTDVSLKPWWKLCESIDHGLQNPTAVGWWAITDPCRHCGSPTYILCDEHYEGGGKAVAYHCDIIKNKREQFKPHTIAVSYLDSACWAHNQSKGEAVFSIADEYREQGVYPVPGAKQWDTAYSRITQLLKPCPGALHPATGAAGSPHLFYLAHCVNFEKEILAYRWKKARGLTLRNAPDEPIDHNDHHMDALAYLVASKPSAPSSPEAPPLSPLDIFAHQRERYNPLAEPVSSGSWMSI